MQFTTTIDSKGISVSLEDTSVLGISFFNNTKISFLPVGLQNNFPHLELYFAPLCSIGTVSKENFRNLVKLRTVHLWNNQIKKIDSSTFDDLASLEHLDLSSSHSF